MCPILPSLAFTSDLQTMQDIWRNCGPSSWSALITLSEPWISSSIGSDNRFVRKIAWNRKKMSIGIGLIQTWEEISMSSWINFSREELERTYFIQGSLFLIVSDDIDTASRTLQEHCRNNCVFMHADEAERKQSKFSRSRPLDMSQREFRQIGESAMQSDMRGAELVMSQFQNPTVFLRTGKYVLKESRTQCPLSVDIHELTADRHLMWMLAYAGWSGAAEILITTIKTFPGTDMAILGLTDHNILTYGSFGLWSTLLSDKFDTKQVILPKGYEKNQEMKDVMDARFPNWRFIWGFSKFMAKCLQKQ